MPNQIMKFFSYYHLPNNEMREISKACSDLADYIEGTVDDCAEKSAGLRKLLEAKDCFVRATIK